VTVLSPAGRFQSKFLQEGFDCLTIPLDRKQIFGPSDIKSIWELLRGYIRHRPAVVHHFTIKAALYGMLAAKVARIPYRINAITGLGYLFTSRARRVSLVRIAVLFGLRVLLTGSRTYVVVQNKYDEAFLLQNRVGKKENIFLIPGSGVDVAHFSPLPRRPERNEIRVLMASRILVDKGVREYVGAAQIIGQSRNNVEFLLAGTPDLGNPSSIHDSEIVQWESFSGLRMLGYVEKIRDLLCSVDIFVLPSYREGLPRSLLEAASCHLPIVTTDVPGCNDVVIQNLNGILVPPKQTEPLARAIIQLIDQPELREKMGRRGRKRVEDLFSDDRVLTETAGIYRTFQS